ncbi:MAG: DUF5343 domain-containing protein [Dehalococcoidales bacterium]|nr:DUF5343 domain-containing protein [Dehalococcoidales bacterium]
MTVEEGRKHLPPYVSYKTFSSFLSRLQQHLPTRIDRSYWGDMFSGSSGTQLMAAMRFLDLVDVNARPTPHLKLLVSATGDHRAVLLKQVTTDAYGFVLKGTLDPQNATYAELEEVFQNTFRMKGDVCRKCIKFFTEITRDAGITLSPAFAKKHKVPRTTTGTKIVAKKNGTRTNQNFPVPFSDNKITELDPWHKMLIDKFPAFDPTWSDDIKMNWFNALGQLIKLNPHADS